MRQIFYLIELLQHGSEPASWWTGLFFSDDVSKAARFPLKLHAQAALDRMKVADEIDRSLLQVTEHVWDD